MKCGFVLVYAALGVLAGILAAGCGSGPNVTVAITSPTAAQMIEAGQTVSITASATGSGNNSGTSVNWSLNGVGCSGAACGALSSETGNSVTYNAPSTPPPANVTVYVIATAATGAHESASLSITVEAISVSIKNKIAEAAAVSETTYEEGVEFAAIVQNDPANQGVTWTLTANGAPCSPSCGTLRYSSPAAVNYLPPASVPAAPNNTPTIAATSESNPGNSDTDTFTIFDGAAACATGGNENLLKGEYAIMLQGWIGSGSTTNPLLFGASFGADGTGKITGGADQFDPFVNMSYAGAGVLPSASSYSVGPDNRGCLTLTDQTNHTFTFQFSLGGVSAGTASQGNIILYTKLSATPMNATGILRLQDPSAFSQSALAPNYAFGVDGWENSTGSLAHLAMAGTFAQSGGNLSSAAFDGNDGGKLSGLTLQAGASFGTISGPVSSTTGMATGKLQIGSPIFTADVEVYIINSSELFLVSYDLGGMIAGRAIATSSSFTPASISPGYIFQSTGSSAGAASASIGVVGFSGGGTTGTVSGKMYSYTSGAGTTQSVAGNYAFTSAAGRLAVTSGSEATSPVCYLTNPSDQVAAFCISTDSTSSLGVLDTQPAATYGNSSVSGNFFFGSGEPGDSTVPDLSGIASISAGSLTGTQDASGPNGLALESAISAALSINADGTGTMGQNGVMVTNGTEICFINEANGAPAAVQTFQQ